MLFGFPDPFLDLYLEPMDVISYAAPNPPIYA